MATGHLGASLAVLFVLAAACGASPARCNPYTYYQCGSGDCIFLWNKCDGVAQCDDQSDEAEATCSAPNTTLASGSVVARVQFSTDLHNSVLILLCGARCSYVRLEGRDEFGAGSLWYDAYTGCNREGNSCQHMIPTHLRYPAIFPDGELVLVVDRRASELAVWQESRPEEVATVPVEDDQTALRIRPYEWKADMPVQFQVPESTTEAGSSSTESARTESAFTESASTEAASTESASTESASTESASTQAASTESASTKSASTESASTGAASTESASTGAASTESASTESASTESASTEAASTESASTESASTESASTEAASTESASTEAASTESASTESASTESAGTDAASETESTVATGDD